MKKGGGKHLKNFRSKSKGAVVFPNVKIVVFLFFLFVCAFLQKRYKIWAFSQFWPLLFLGILGAKCRVNNWATVGSIIGPHLGSYF